MTEISISIPASAQPSGKAVFVMLGTGFDEIEALAPIDVMRRAGMDVFTVSMTENRLVKGATGNNIVADMSISDLSPDNIDWLVFPGADKSEDAVNLNEDLCNIVKKHWNNGGNIAAICAAPALVLGPLGIINGIEATGYPFLKEDFEKNGGIYSEEPVVIGNRLITSKGPGTTLEFALAIVRNVKGAETEKVLREGMVVS
ncbi:DJ-1 family glyoxalase III [Bacteroides acidifaciens]|jgi:DJ-1 family protein|uniref:DJ-1 family glyoxalase III n=1 Tax=Bacteroides acidifaciens TaxID=85831 RepID=UPI002729669B|nr:DJ-1 family glyoxalase III [Bacteroides acidifaciens]